MRKTYQSRPKPRACPIPLAPPKAVSPATVPGALLQLHRIAGNQRVQQILRQSGERNGSEHLHSPRFAGSAKLERCLNNLDRVSENDSDRDAVIRIQQALLDMPSVTGNKYDLGPKGADGNYGAKTAAAIRKFKADEQLGSTQFGDVGPGTTRRLDQLFTSEPPKPEPVKKPALNLIPNGGPPAASAKDQATYSIQVQGQQFSPNIPLTITFDNAEEFHAVTDASGAFSRIITPTRRQPGNFPVRAFSPLKGSDDASATFSVSGGLGPPGPQDQRLEDLLDRIQLQMQLSLSNQRDAIDRFEKDMAAPDKSSNNFFKQAIKLALLNPYLKFVTSALYGVGEGALRQFVVQGDKPLQKDADNSLDKVCDKAMDWLKDLADSGNDEGPRFDQFVDFQRREVTTTSFRQQEQYLGPGKEQLRRIPTGPTAPGVDPRVDRATKVEQNWKNAAAAAFRDRYQSMADAWGSLEAQQGPGDHLTTKDQADQNEVGPVKVSTGGFEQNGVFGILYVTDADFQDPGHKASLRGSKASIKGFSEKTRARLEESSISGMRLPVVISGDITRPSGELRISQNEEGEHTNVKPSAENRKWLANKAAVDQLGNDNAEKSALDFTVSELGGSSLKQNGIKLED